MRQRDAVQFIPVLTPVRYEPIQQADKGGVVRGFEEGHQLVDNDVFEAFTGHFGKFTEGTPREVVEAGPKV